MLSLTTMYTAVYLLSFALLLNFHFCFKKYFKKYFFIVQYSSPLLLAHNQYLSYLPSICHKLCWDFLRHVFSFNTKFFLWLLFNLLHLAYLCVITKNNNFFNSVNLSFTWALSIQFSSYFLLNNVILFDLVLNFENSNYVPNFKSHNIYIY